MKQNRNGQNDMADFILNAVEAEDLETVEMIRPLPEDVVPSEKFRRQTRLRLLRISTQEADADAGLRVA